MRFEQVLAAGALPISLLLAGCAVSSQPVLETAGGGSTAADTYEVISTDEMPEARRQAIAQFPEQLPTGIVWPDWTAAASAAAEQNVVAEVGVAETAVAEFWLCAWMAEYIEAADGANTAGARSALNEIEKYTNLPAIVAHHQNAEVFESAVIDTANQGDSTNLRNFFKSCGVLNY